MSLPWERALARDPMCAFVEAVVDGYSPLDKHLCKLARAGSLLRSLPWWTQVPPGWGPRGSVRFSRTSPFGSVVGYYDEWHGEIEAR